jgi:hypothetical protein
MLVFGEVRSEGLTGELQALAGIQHRALHPLHGGRQHFEALTDLERGADDIIDHVAPVRDPPDGEHASRDHQAIRADDPEEPHPELIGARPVVSSSLQSRSVTSR